jgi:hypothetical protein
MVGEGKFMVALGEQPRQNGFVIVNSGGPSPATT